MLNVNVPSRSQSDTSSVSALQPGYSDQDSVGSVGSVSIKIHRTDRTVRTQDRKRELCTLM